ncbi:MAG TPA: YidB family protein [Gemmatimonadaceae bacterium]
MHCFFPRAAGSIYYWLPEGIFRWRTHTLPTGVRVAPTSTQAGGIMGMFDGLLGGVVGAEMATVVNGLIEKHGGVQGIVSQLQSQGLGNTVKSWVGTGANEPITGEQLHSALGSDMINQLAAKVGMTPQELSAKLAQVLPGAIDKLTPAGTVPTTP